MKKIYKNVSAIALGFLGIIGASQAQVTFTDDFESGLGNWSGSYSASTTSACNTTSVRDNIYGSDPSGNLTAASSLGTSNGGVVTLDFNYKIVNFSGLTATTVDHGTTDVQIATTSSGPWTTVFTIDASNHVTSATCAPINTTFSAPPGDFYIRFNTTYGGSGDYYFYIDDIVISQGPAPSCVQPTALTATNVTSTTADLGWTAGATQLVWNVEWGTVGFTPATGAQVGSSDFTSSNPVNAMGLMPSSDYEFYVQSVCSSPLIISGVYDGPLTGGTPKGVELYVAEDIADLSQFGIGSAANGGASSGADFVFPAVAVTAGTYIYVASETAEFTNYFGFAPDYTDGSMNINGDDVVELFHNSTVVDVFGDLGVDGTGTAWEYLDGWAYRNNGTLAGGTTFNAADWTFSGPNALDPCSGATNGTCASMIPVGTFTSTIDASSWAGPFAFSTQCSPITTFPYVEDFETGGAGWTFGGSQSSWAIGTPSNTNITAAANGTGAVVTNLTGDYNANEFSYLYTPCFNFSSFNYPVIEFNHIRDFENCCDEGWVEFTTDGATWTKLGTTTSWMSNGYNDAGNQWWDSDNTTWTLTAHELTTLVGQAYVQFRFVMSADFIGQQEGQGVDDFSIYDVACPDPTNLIASWIDNDSVIVEWDAGYLEADWNVELGATGFMPGTSTEIYAGTVSGVPTDTIGGLMQITDYDVYVQADCGADSSAWVGPVTFTTLPNCAAPTAFTAMVISADSVGLDWTAGSTGETEWTIEYGQAGFMPGTGTYVSVIGNSSDTLDMLMQNTAYDFYLLGNCSATDSSLWVGPETVTTPLFCDNVSNLSATTVTDTAFLSWSAGPDGESMWNVEYGFSGFTLGTGTMYSTSVNTMDTLMGLMPSGVYDYYVQAACASGDTSLFTGPYTFTMPLGNDTACSANNLSVDGMTRYFSNSGASATADETSNLSIPAGTDPSGSCVSNDGWCSFELSISRSIWFSFTAPASGNVNVNCAINSSYDGQVAIFDITDCGDMTTATFLGGNDDDPAGGFAPNVTVCGLTPGNTYYVMHDEYNGSVAGTVSMTLTEVSVDAGIDGMMNVCATETIDLNTVANTNSGGMWMFDINPNAIMNDSMFVANSVPAGMYDLYYVIQEDCARDTATASLNIVSVPNTGVAIDPFVSCNSDVFLPNGLTGTFDIGGTWTDNSNTGLLAGSENNVFVAADAPVGFYDFTYTVDNGVCPPASTTLTVNIENCTGIDESNTSFSMFPNPADQMFTVAGESIESVVLLDAQGKIVRNLSNTNQESQVVVDVTDLDAGMYLVKVVANGTTGVKSMIIK